METHGWLTGQQMIDGPALGETTPGHLGAPFEWPSLLITLAAFITLWRYKVGIVPVIGACALAGLAYSVLL